ncbi:MAG: TIR domain-containing protein [Aggregatilineales bacterium]
MDDYEFEEEPIEGYCMRCRESVEIEAAKPVWTRKGQAATRGECSLCGGTVFRMGKTYLHDEANRPDAVVIDEAGEKRNRAKLSRDTVYVNFATADETQARQIADDLEKSGMAVWLHDPSDDTAWSGGVHPALKDCKRMVLVLSEAIADDITVNDAWRFFKQERKPIVLAQIAPADAPDRIRRSPRFDFSADFKVALRQMLGALSE